MQRNDASLEEFPPYSYHTVSRAILSLRKEPLDENSRALHHPKGAIHEELGTFQLPEELVEKVPVVRDTARLWVSGAYSAGYALLFRSPNLFRTGYYGFFIEPVRAEAYPNGEYNDFEISEGATLNPNHIPHWGVELFRDIKRSDPETSSQVLSFLVNLEYPQVEA